MRADAKIAGAFHFPGGPQSCLLLHGFSGTPAHLRFIGQRLSEAGYTVDAPLLPGHGTTVEDMEKHGWRDWLDAAREAYAALARRSEAVNVVGLSMGGTLGLLLAAEYPVASLSCLSAAIRVMNPAARFAPLIRPFMPYRSWQYRAPDASYDMLRELDCGYDGLATKNVSDLNRLCRMAARSLYAVVAPTLIVQPERDMTVNPVSARIIYRGISSREKRILYLPRSRHVCSIGPERELVAKAILGNIHNIPDTKSLAR